MIAQAGIDRRLQPMELLSHLLLDQRAHAAVDDIACQQDEIRILSIDHIHPTGQFLTWIVIAQMQVGGHHHLIVLGQRFGRFQLQRYAYLIIIMEVAIEEDAEYEYEDTQGRIAVMIEEGLRHEMDQSPQVEHQKDDDEIHQDEDRRGANLVCRLCQREGQAIEPASEIQEEHDETEYANGDDQQLPQSGDWQHHPYMPGNVGDGQNRQNHKEYHPHIFHILYNECKNNKKKMIFHRQFTNILYLCNRIINF